MKASSKEGAFSIMKVVSSIELRENISRVKFFGKKYKYTPSKKYLDFKEMWDRKMRRNDKGKEKTIFC